MRYEGDSGPESAKEQPSKFRKIFTGCLYGGAGLALCFVLFAVIVGVCSTPSQTPSQTSASVTRPQASALLTDAVEEADYWSDTLSSGEYYYEVTRDDIRDACRKYSELGWDYARWVSYVDSETEEYSGTEYLEWQAFYQGVHIGMEYADSDYGRAQEGCRRMGLVP